VPTAVIIALTEMPLLNIGIRKGIDLRVVGMKVFLPRALTVIFKGLALPTGRARTGDVTSPLRWHRVLGV
jgi:hypothetical protein